MPEAMIPCQTLTPPHLTSVWRDQMVISRTSGIWVLEIVPRGEDLPSYQEIPKLGSLFQALGGVLGGTGVRTQNPGA